MKKVLFLVLMLCSVMGWSHKFYVSIADLSWDQDEQRIEGSIKLTAHDIEKMLANKFERSVDLEVESDSSEVGQYLQAYLARNFTVKSNDQWAIPNYIGKEITLRGELFIYFTFTGIQQPESIEISNKILFELFPKQQNIVHYKYKDQTKSVTLIPSKTHGKIEFD
jgi:hypothetical protein